MAAIIKKIRLINFKRFKDYVIEPNKRINVFIGDNEAGKSSILEAIALVSNGNVGRVESIGLDRLFNMDVITEFLERKEFVRSCEEEIKPGFTSKASIFEKLS